MVYGVLGRTATIMRSVYRNFDPSTVSDELLKHYKSKLEKLNLYAAGIMGNSGNLKANSTQFADSVKDFEDALWEIHTDMQKNPA